MQITRRTLVKLLGATSLTVFGSARWARATPDAQPFFLLFDDIKANTPADALDTFLAPFAELGIPIGFIIKPDDNADVPAAGGSAISLFLREFLRNQPGLGEAIAWMPGIAADEPYFQIRKARAVRGHLEAFLDLPAEGSPDLFSPITIAGNDLGGFLALDAMRSVGFRNIIMLSQKNAASSSERCVNTTSCMRGSLRHTVTDGAYSIISSVRAAIGAGDMVVLNLSVENIDKIPIDALRIRASALADEIASNIQTSRIFAALPREHVFWFSTGTERLIGLRIDAPPQTDQAAELAFADFQSELTKAAIPFSVSAKAQKAPAGDTTQCPVLTATTALDELGGVTCAVADMLPTTVLAQFADAGLEVVVQPVGSDKIGVDENGLFHLAENLSITAISSSGPGLHAFGSSQDIIIAISPAAYASAEGRTAILSTLREATKAGASSVLNIPDFAKAVLPDDPVYRVMLATRHDVNEAPQTSPRISDEERGALFEDAKIAWSYIDRMTEPVTGLCPTTVLFEGPTPIAYRILTMWDYGSLIQAVIASHELGLIDDAQYLTRVEALMRGLPVEKIGGLALPSSEIATDRLKSVSHDYNSCDTGRLLSALSELDNYPLSKAISAGSVAKWDLDGTLHDGRLTSVTRGRFVPSYHSHCTHYATRAFRHWGIEAASPYDAMQGSSVTDARMRLLYEVARIGAFGAEPLLLEAVELGLSEPSAYLADVLFTAQARHFATTGNLMCVSEGPMDHLPWFTYQGFRVNSETESWDVQAINPAPEYKSDSFRKSARIISTKAAFLWAAVRPGPYSSLLLAHVRQNARASEAGYSAGIYAATGRAMTNYSDVNTNGVILQAIAYVMRGSVPRFLVSP
ncbi:MAG: DUF3131 domain-containing protein [Pseudorhodobacter sp.]|nr:DUF3131 domain-containing protein [Pseudorhodobacter sp.]